MVNAGERVLGLCIVSMIVGTARGAMPPVPVPPENPITEGKRVLGKTLFWDEQLSSDGTIACGTCHVSGRSMSDPRIGVHPGADGLFGSPDDILGSPGVVRRDHNLDPIFDDVFGFNPQVTGRSAPTAMGGAQYAADLFWDGRARSTFIDPQTSAVSIPLGGGLESQAIGPVLSDVEMAHEGRTWEDVIEKLGIVEPMALARNVPSDVASALLGEPSYPDLFEAAFGDSAITAERIAFSIATYERTLIPDQTPWDRFTGGDPTALTSGQQLGLFFFSNGPITCRICHAPPLFTDNTFRNIGLRPWEEDVGRFDVTQDFSDRGRFKVASLRGVGLKSRFMHNGRLASLNQVIDFYMGINGQVQFPENRDPLVPQNFVPPPVRSAFIDFLTNGLTDPRVANEVFPFDRPWLHSELGDGNRDGVVDIADFDGFLECVGNPGAADADAGCLLFDFDGDGGVDFADFADFQIRIQEP